jgi:hypothetical protein
MVRRPGPFGSSRRSPAGLRRGHDRRPRLPPTVGTGLSGWSRPYPAILSPRGGPRLVHVRGSPCPGTSGTPWHSTSACWQEGPSPATPEQSVAGPVVIGPSLAYPSDRHEAIRMVETTLSYTQSTCNHVQSTCNPRSVHVRGSTWTPWRSTSKGVAEGMVERAGGPPCLRSEATRRSAGHGPGFGTTFSNAQQHSVTR